MMTNLVFWYRITNQQEDLFRGNLAEREPNPANETLVSFCLCDGSRECGRKAVSDTTADGTEPQRFVRLGVPRAPVRRKRETSGSGDTGDDDTGDRRTYHSDYEYELLVSLNQYCVHLRRKQPSCKFVTLFRHVIYGTSFWKCHKIAI